ncbi:hypothetical protein BHM03_00020606 [Ensete ventricosum]|nr:hypothetical protein BHM03_00020606 [Ensete ventricosum]
MRRCLVLLLEGEAAPHLPALCRGDASFSRWKTPRSPAGRCLVFLRWDEALPRSSARRRGSTSSSSAGTRCCLVLTLEDEASPRLPAMG